MVACIYEVIILLLNPPSNLHIMKEGHAFSRGQCFEHILPQAKITISHIAVLTKATLLAHQQSQLGVFDNTNNTNDIIIKIINHFVYSCLTTYY